MYIESSLTKEYAYLNRQKPSLHDGPKYPALHHVGHIPVSGEQWVGSKQ